MDIDKLRELVAEYLISCEEYHSHLRTPKEIRYNGDYSSWQHWLGMYEREKLTLHHALSLICEVVDVDMETLISVEKSFLRQEKKTSWGWVPDIYRLPKHECSYLGAVKNRRNFYETRALSIL